MIQIVKKIAAKVNNTVLWLFCSLAATPVFAQTGGSFGGVNADGFMDDSKAQIGKGLNMAGLVVGAIGFLAVAYYAVAIFSEVQKGKKTWTDFGAVALVGVVMLILVFWMLSKMGGISGLTGIGG